jgi:hypothetical protein
VFLHATAERRRRTAQQRCAALQHYTQKNPLQRFRAPNQTQAWQACVDGVMGKDMDEGARQAAIDSCSNVVRARVRVKSVSVDTNRMANQTSPPLLLTHETKTDAAAV